MQYPDQVTRLRATGTDEYGNPDRSWATPDALDLQGFVMYGLDATTVFLPPLTDVLEGDRMVVESDTYTVKGAKRVRSPSREVMTTAVLEPIAGG